MLSNAVVFSPQSEYAKEMAKWEPFPSPFGPPGRPYQYREYPAMLYRPTRDVVTGKVSFESRVAEDEQQRAVAEGAGFVSGGQGKALEALEAREFEQAELAANRAFSDRKMSPEAQAEAARVDASTSQHLAVIPEAPIKRRGRPKKVATE